MDLLMIPQLILPMFRDHLQSLGYDATIADEGRQKAMWPGREMGEIVLADGPVEAVAMALPGLSSARPSNWSHLTRVGKLPISARKVWPVEYHFKVRSTGLVDKGTFKAKWKGPDATPRWRGGRLAGVLSATPPLTEALRGHLEKTDRLSVRADPRNQVIRIVYETRRVIGFALLPKPKVELEGGWPSRELMETVGRVAEVVRAFL